MSSDPLKFRGALDVAKIIPQKGHPYTIRKQENLPIYFFKFADTYTQGLTLDRLLFFVESKPDELFTDAALRLSMLEMGLSGSLGQDFRLSDVARFFTEANRRKVKLNQLECRLREELLNAGLLKKDTNSFIAKDGAIISTPVREQINIFDDSFGDRLLSDIAHEFNHGIYFTEKTYRDAINDLWANGLSPVERQFARDILKGICNSLVHSLDSDPDLLIREFTAWFRDNKELIDHVLVPLGSEVIKSDQASQLFDLRRFYSEDGTLKRGIADTVRSLSNRILALDDISVAYRRPLGGTLN